MSAVNISNESSSIALARRNRKTLSIVLVVVLMMIGLSYASVPLYSLFCRATGYGGTTQTTLAFPKEILDRKVTIHFDTNISSDLNWDFTPEQRSVDLRLGERGFMAFKARNRTNVPITGVAVFNVTPLKVGKYFQKIQCFCFGEQILNAGQSVSMPVLFFVDPAMDQDPNMKDVTTITLSYTFFKSESLELDHALEAFYNSDGRVISTTDF